MKGFLLMVAVFCGLFLVAMLGDAQAHGGGVVVRDFRGRAVVVDRGFHGRNVVVDGRGVVVARGGVVVRGNRSFFNQDGGRNRFGFRR